MNRPTFASKVPHSQNSQHSATTVVGVSKDGIAALAADGQVTLGERHITKGSARKLHRLEGGNVIAGIAGSVGDALLLLEAFENQTSAFPDDLNRAAIEFVRQWRTDRFLRRLQAQLVVADADNLLLVSGEGDVIVPDEPVIAIGSGMAYAQAAASALLENTKLSAAEIAAKAIEIAGRHCVYTNDSITVEEVGATKSTASSKAKS